MPSTSTSPVSRGPVVPPDTPINLKILQAELEELKKANKTLNQQQQAKQVCHYLIQILLDKRPLFANFL